MKFGALILLLFVSLSILANRTAAQTNRWQTEIYDNIWLNGEPVVRRTDGVIGFDWGAGTPSSGVEPDFFSIRWTSQMVVREDSTFRFNVRADDGIRVFVDGQTVLYAWEGQAKPGVAADRWLSAGSHTIVVEYFEHSGNAYAFFDYALVESGIATPNPILTVTPSSPLPTTTPVPFVTNTLSPPIATSVPANTNTPLAPATFLPTMTQTPRPMATQQPSTQFVPTIRPILTPQPTTPTPSRTPCDLTPQPMCVYYWSRIYREILPLR